ncbi:HAD family hydrolase [Sphingomonas bacterium]|uniref:HAD family hydrolase n=1 Tax=Sphingomonas bacterium TaxID=1895847 RepID=UPI0015777757|nr:HAD family phosphatase [Sphingomonas bacterium]
MRVDALLFDFDGVLIESEWVGARQIADWLTANGHPTSVAQATALFSGHAGDEFRARVARHLGGPIPAAFDAARAIEDARVLREGVGEVAGAVAFVRSLPADLPRAIVSSSSTAWIGTHLAHLGLGDAFPHRFSGREHVARPKPAPDLYHHAAAALGVPIERCAIIEDSRVGATGAVASGGYVIGLTAGLHCGKGHGDALLALGVDAVAADFGEVARLLGLARDV